ncbi:MAG: 3-oxoacyl-ACP reductase FabG [Ferruginibacter sp.]
MKFALVTGGSRGIGRAVCSRLAAMGYNILINYRSNEAEALQTKAMVEEQGMQAELLPFDVTSREEIKTKLGEWLENNKDKTIEVLVNNAGIREDGLLVFMQDEQWDRVLKTNLDSFFFVTKMVISDMLVKKFGRIINMVSLSGLKGLPGQTNYSAAKAGVIGATRALAQEVGRKGVTVNAVAPGFIKTDMTEGLDEKELKNMIPVKRFGTAEEVAHAVGFLASAGAGYITGEVISVNGGLY